MGKKIVIMVWVCLLAGISGFGQSFLQQQLSYPVFRSAYERKDSVLSREFKEKGLIYPAKFIYLRSFKYDSHLEVWVKNNESDTFRLFKSYPICALSGKMGPKRQEGDYQVPEGFYYIDEFNPKSVYHLALGVNYPNFSDKIQGNRNNPGGGIFIHGSCVTVGCIPLTNPRIEEVYLLAVHARDLGQDYIPVHIFPVNFNNQRSISYLNTNSVPDGESQRFWLPLKEAFDYFNQTHRLPLILYDGKGNYEVDKNQEAPSTNVAATTGNNPQHTAVHTD